MYFRLVCQIRIIIISIIIDDDDDDDDYYYVILDNSVPQLAIYVMTLK